MKLNFIFILLFFPNLMFAQGNGLYKFIGKNGKYGFMDKTGKVIIPAKYIRIGYPGFSEGLAFVSEKKATNGSYNWVCIDMSGKEVFSVAKQSSPETGFSEGYAVITDYVNDWFINRSGKQVFEIKFSNACGFTNGFARVNYDSYFIDKKGEKVLYLPLNCAMFNNGIAYCGTRIIDTYGNTLIDNIDEITDLSNEYIKVKRNNKWGFIDRKGNIIIDFQYEQDSWNVLDMLLNIKTDSLDALPKTTYRNIGFFYEGLASIQKDSLFGFINLKNEIVIEPIFKKVQYFSEGLAGVSLDGKTWGFINKEGKFVIESEYYFVDSFKNGVCGVLLTNERMYIGDYHLNAIINKNNEILYKAEMHSYRGFQGELIQYYEGWDFNGRIHYLDKFGKPVIPKE